MKLLRKLFLPVMALLSISLVLTVPIALSGCKSTLEPGGAYAPVTVSNGITNAAPDMPLFLADSAYRLAYTSLDAVFTTEKVNRSFLWTVSPDIKHALDRLRPEATKANTDYLLARSVYIASPTPENLTGVHNFLAKIQQLATAAQAALPKQ